MTDPIRIVAAFAALVVCAALGGCGAVGIWVPYPKSPAYKPAVDTIRPGATTRQEVLQLVANASLRIDTPRFLWAEWREAYAGYWAAQYPAGGGGKHVESGEYARSVHLAAVFDERGLVQQHCRARYGDLDKCLASLAAIAPPPIDAALPIDFETTTFAEDWTIRANFYGHITVAGDRVCLVTDDPRAVPVRVLPASALVAVSLAPFRLLLQAGGHRLKTGEARVSDEEKWRLIWLLYSGRAPTPEPARGRDAAFGPGGLSAVQRPDPSAVRVGSTTRTELQALAGRFETAADPGGTLFWARWKQVNTRFGTGPHEPYWEIVNLLAIFDDHNLVAHRIFCRDPEIFGNLRSLKAELPAAALPPPPFHLRFIHIDGVSRRFGGFEFTLDASRLLLTEDSHSWQFPPTVVEGADPTPLSTVEAMQWRIRMSQNGKPLRSVPQSLTPAQTWLLAATIR